MQPCQLTVFHQPQRVFKHRPGLGRKSGDNIGPKHHFGAPGLDILTKTDGIIAQMPPFHPLKDHVVARLQ